VLSADSTASCTVYAGGIRRITQDKTERAHGFVSDWRILIAAKGAARRARACRAMLSRGMPTYDRAVSIRVYDAGDGSLLRGFRVAGFMVPSLDVQACGWTPRRLTANPESAVSSHALRPDSAQRPRAPKSKTARFPAFFCTFRFGPNLLPVLGFEVRARCEWLRVAASPLVHPETTACAKNIGEGTAMATLTLTVRLS
jgi:hypothetical protein